MKSQQLSASLDFLLQQLNKAAINESASPDVKSAAKALSNKITLKRQNFLLELQDPHSLLHRIAKEFGIGGIAGAIDTSSNTASNPSSHLKPTARELAALANSLLINAKGNPVTGVAAHLEELARRRGGNSWNSVAGAMEAVIKEEKRIQAQIAIRAVQLLRPAFSRGIAIIHARFQRASDNAAANAAIQKFEDVAAKLEEGVRKGAGNLSKLSSKRALADVASIGHLVRQLIPKLAQTKQNANPPADIDGLVQKLKTLSLVLTESKAAGLITNATQRLTKERNGKTLFVNKNVSMKNVEANLQRARDFGRDIPRMGAKELYAAADRYSTGPGTLAAKYGYVFA